ncbi:ketopantoate reductase family protein [Promicromonospora sp. NPDC019610]|uniref:ketopantoate reductase family protein n=1 Tax=Promicromonospora sp. NPDC019610 TaxID=3364405 RepID=UPI00378E6855
MSGAPVAVVGPGAIGGLMAALLQRAGHDVTVVAREATAAHIAEHGLDVVSDMFGSWHAPLAASTAVPRGARVLVAVKADGVAATADLLRAADPAEVIALLNGVEHMVPLRAAAPGAAVFGATIAGQTRRTPAEGPGPATVTHSFDLLTIVVPDAAADLGLTAALRDTGAALQTGGTEAEVLWKKLRFLAGLSLLTSTWKTGIADALDRDPALTAGLLDEIAAVASAEGVPSTGDGLRGLLAGMPPLTVGSLEADLSAGRPGELDAIGGAILRAGARRGIVLPVLTATVDKLAASVGR